MTKKYPSLGASKAILHLITRPLFLWVMISVLTIPGLARAATIIVDDPTQVVSSIYDTNGNGYFDYDNNLLQDETEANDLCTNTDACPRTCTDNGPCDLGTNLCADLITACYSDRYCHPNADGIPDGNDDCKCQFSEGLLAINSGVQVDSCVPDAGGDPFFGLFDTIILSATGPYEFQDVDNFGDNNLNSGNGPNALPKIVKPVFIDGNSQTLTRIPYPCEVTEGECINSFRLFEVDDSLTSIAHMEIYNFDPDCVEVNGKTNRGYCVNGDDGQICYECYNGGFMFVSGAIVDLDDIAAHDNQTNITYPTNGMGGAIFIEGSGGDDKNYPRSNNFNSLPRRVSESAVSIHNSDLHGNKALVGGAITVGTNNILTIENTTIRENEAIELDMTAGGDEVTGIGGGLAVTNGPLTINTSSIFNNTAPVMGGGLGILNIFSNDNGNNNNAPFVTMCTGGGVENCCGNGYTEGVNNEQCDDGNITSGDGCNGGCQWEYCGDGIVNNSGTEECDGGSLCSSKCKRLSPSVDTITNTTIGMNDSGVGGGIAFLSVMSDEISLNLRSDTIAFNGGTSGDLGALEAGVMSDGSIGTTSGGGIYSIGPVTMKNTIFSDNVVKDGGDGPDCHGSITSDGHNHISYNGDSSCMMTPVSGDLIGFASAIPAGLVLPVADDTTPGNAHFDLDPSIPSPAIDTGSGPDCPAYDQIHFNRDKNGNSVVEFGECSKGAIEYQGVCGDTILETVGLGEECDPASTTCDGLCKLIPPPECGNGIPESGEDCDDHNNIIGDGCSSMCKTEVCGDIFVSPYLGETCDNGMQCEDNTTPCTTATASTACAGIGSGTCAPRSGDGCDKDCHLETTTGGGSEGFCGDNIIQGGEECDDGDASHGAGNSNTPNKCRTNCKLPRCGDDLVDAGEVCDDGNTNDQDSCRNSCTNNICGDGVRNIGVEECDDGNNNYGDGCTADCRNEFCGDHVVQTSRGEQCDNGGTCSTDTSITCTKHADCPSGGICIPRSGDGCDQNCINEVAPRCGDGIPQGLEDCDDGNLVPGDGCSPTCTNETCGDGIITAIRGEQCEPPSVGSCDSACHTIAPICGDGVQQPGEQCDDGKTCAGTTTTCTKDSDCSEVVVTGACDYHEDDDCTNHCQLPRCGDGIRHGDEECDDGNSNSFDDCTKDCMWNVCGDGIIHKVDPGRGSEAGPKELCDDGNNLDDDSCRNDCTPAWCGDRVIAFEGGEECDDGDKLNGIPGDPCSKNCQEIPPGGGPVCGDGVKNGTEECDDGNGINTDGCTNLCNDPVCGDGFVETGVEECDDGGTVDGDGCSAACKTETPPPPPTVAPACGDGHLDAGEACDNGPLNSDTASDACRTTCEKASCGDGVCDDSDPTGCEDCKLDTTTAGFSCDPIVREIIKHPRSEKWRDVASSVDARFGVGVAEKCSILSGGALGDSGNISSKAGCSLDARPQITEQTSTAMGLCILLTLMVPVATLGSVRRVRGRQKRR